MSEKEYNIAEAMDLILNGQAKTASVDVIATAKIVNAAKILHQTGFEEDAKLVIASLEEKEIQKQASDNTTEEVLFEITSDKALS